MDLKGKKILVVVAHPDDETIGCGGFLAKAVRAGAICSVVLPLQRSNQRTPDAWDVALLHFRRACEILGAKPIVLDDLLLDNTQALNVQVLAQSIDPYIASADLILTHWKGDLHHAHVAISKAVELCTRPFRNRKAVWCFEILTSTDQGFENTFSPNCFVSLSSDDVNQKMAAMSEYISEIFPGRTPEDLELHMRFRGRQAGTDWAESFYIARSFV